MEKPKLDVDLINYRRILAAASGLIGVAAHLYYISWYFGDRIHREFEPYAMYMRVSDAFWIILFLTSIVLALRSNMPLRRGYSIALALILLIRFWGGRIQEQEVFWLFGQYITLHSPREDAKTLLFLESPVLLIIGLIALYGLLYGVLEKREGFCRTCGYNLTGNTSGICPECGKVISSDNDADVVVEKRGTWRD